MPVSLLTTASEPRGGRFALSAPCGSVDPVPWGVAFLSCGSHEAHNRRYHHVSRAEACKRGLEAPVASTGNPKPRNPSGPPPVYVGPMARWTVPARSDDECSGSAANVGRGS